MAQKRDNTSTRYTISLSLKNRKHRVIDDYIRGNAESDGRGLRVQPIIEQLLYECAISGLPLMDILWSIRDAGKGGSDARRSSHSGVAAMAHQDAHGMLDGGAQNERNFAHEQPPEIDNGPPEIDIGAAPIGDGGASREARLLAKSIIGKGTT